MFELKQLSSEAIDRSLEKAERYRLLNEPEQAESICLDVLTISPNNQKALVTLLLALTDQFPHGSAESVRRAQEVLSRFEGAYERVYYAGIIAERRAYARLTGRSTGAESVAYELFRQAMELYEKAEALSPFGNEDALLRWNTCARQIMQHRLEPAQTEPSEPLLLE
jgi:tetratricopeptide (TPR) repeat protein